MEIPFKKAVELLQSGKVIAVPTETVYGLAALYQNVEGIKEIYRLKNRPPKNPLIMHVAKKEEAAVFVPEFPSGFHELAEAFWPGPLTLVMPALESKVPSIVRAGLVTQSFRVPDHPLTLDLIKETGPIVAPSANLSGSPSSSSKEHVEADFGLEFPVLDGGPCQKGVESTILVYSDLRWHVGRLGAIAPAAFEMILGYIPEEISKGPLICPGQQFRHYAPKARLYLTRGYSKSKVVIGFSDRAYPEASKVFFLGKSDDPTAPLYYLYEMLRRIDREKLVDAEVDMDFPKEGLWGTLRERLLKASAGLT